MGDTSLVFNLVARDRASGEVSAMGERFNTAAAGIGVAFAAVLGASVMQSMDMEAAGDKLAAQLGVGPAEAAQLAEVSASVYKNAWGDSVDTVNEAIRGVYQNIGDTSQAEGGLEGVTTKALALAQTFNQEVGPTTAAVGQLIKTGLADSADEAFDILTVGFQSSANKADDLLDVVNEYSTQFRRAGLDGQTAMGLLSQGLQNGARDADQVADAVGQFGELALAGGTAVDAAFKSIGLSSSDMANKIGAGGTSAEQALGMTLTALRGTKDEQVKLNAATALFGDPGTVMGDALFALDPATAAASIGMDKASGAADRMAKAVGDNPKAALESFKRTVMVELGDAAGGIATFAMENQAAIIPLMYTFTGLAALVLVVRSVMMVYAAVSTVVTAAHAVISSSTWTVIGNWTRMMAVGLMAYVRIAGAAVVSAATTAGAWAGSALVSIGTWIAAVVRAGLTAAAQFVLMAARAVAWAAVMAAQWLIAMGPIGWVIAAVVGLVALIVLNWDKIKGATAAVWGWIWGKIKGVGAAILGYITSMPLVSYFVRHWDRIKAGLASRVVGLVSYVRGLPGRLMSAAGNLGSLLYNKGRNVVQGLWNGIRSMGGWLAGRVASFARNSVTGAVKGALGINSPSTEMADQVGHWLPPGIAQGAEDNRGVLTRTMSSLVQAPSSTTVAGIGRSIAPALPGGAPGTGGGRTVLEIRSGGSKLDDLLVELLRKAIRTRGGDVQIVLGTG
ncbi:MULTISPECIES: phage tail tape measure protein [unclassified Streptomyces]|uniref:phage tail tape measure protein n=1 Tax=unclassified Streptomyces TaxID=2593676 RepID=UPI00341A5D31